MSVSKFGKLLAVGALAVTMSVPLLAHDRSDGFWSGWWGMGHRSHDWGSDDRMRGWGMGGPMMGAMPSERMLKRIDGRLGFLKAELKITESQTAAWDELASTIRTTAEAHNDMMRDMMKEIAGGDFFKRSLPDRLTYRITHIEARLEQTKSLSDATGKLYAVLDDTQKKAADEIVLPMMGMGMGRGMGMGGYGPMMMH